MEATPINNKHNCFDCLNSIPPQQIALCTNCLAVRTPELFYQHIISEILPLIGIDV